MTTVTTNEQLKFPVAVALQEPVALISGSPLLDLEEAVRIWLTVEVANSDPRADTIASYRQNLDHWFSWCAVSQVDPGCPSRQQVEGYRADLITAGLQASTIGVKLTVVRRFYQSATDRGLIPRNPAAGVKPPMDRRVKNNKKTLTSGQAERLIEALPPPDTRRGNGIG